MNHSAKLSFTVTKDNINSEVIDLLKKLTNNRTMILFAITSDIDNLGIFIARYGRAFGQNLVDYCTNILIQFINSNQSNNKINDLVLIPAGEEDTILGLSSSEDEINNFFSSLNKVVNEQIKTFESDKVKACITFGCQIISDPVIHNQIEALIGSIESDRDYSPTKDYYTILYNIRTLVSLAVDSAKFGSLINSNVEQLIFLRNVVYSEMLDYKLQTQKILRALSYELQDIDSSDNLFKQYGLNSEDHKSIKRLYKHLIT